MGDQRYRYAGDCFLGLEICPRTYTPDYFLLELELESIVFFELRRKNGILPHKIQDASKENLNGIKDFFYAHRDTFFFLFEESNFVGSILLLGNYIQSLAIAPKYQRRGYGERLTKYAINYAYEHGHKVIELDIMDGNRAAERLYEKLGFRKVEES